MLRRCSIVFLSIALFLVMASFVAAQTDGSTGKVADTPKPPPKIVPVPVTPFPPRGAAPVVPKSVPDPIIIEGTVITDDGSAPPFGTVIERDCGTIVTREILVNSNGSFSFVVGNGNKASGLFADASENNYEDAEQNIPSEWSSGNGDWFRILNRSSDISGCVIRAKYPGYRSTAVQLGIDHRLRLIEVGTLILYPISGIKGNSVSITNLKAPKKAKNALGKGMEAFEKNNLPNAEKYYRSALALYPEYSEAWVELGWLFQKEKRYDEARNAYLSAAHADGSYISPYVRLAQLEAMEQNWEKSIEYSNKVLSLDPVSYPQAYFLSGLAYYNLNRLDDAENSIRKGIRMDVSHQLPKMQLVLANILTRRKDPPGAVESMRTYLKLAPYAPDADRIRSLIKKHEQEIRASREAGLGDGR
jgi:Tfp pilus assembly protein PilF